MFCQAWATLLPRYWVVRNTGSSKFALNQEDETEVSAEPDWKGCANVRLRTLESATWFHHYVAAFNINTNQWCMNYIFKRLKFLNNRMVCSSMWIFGNSCAFPGESDCHSRVSCYLARMACWLLCHILQRVHRDLLRKRLLHSLEQERSSGQVTTHDCKLKWRKNVINWFSVPSNLNSFIIDGKSILLTQPSPPLSDGMELPEVLYLFKRLFVTGVTCSSFCHTASCLSHFLGGTASGQYIRWAHVTWKLCCPECESIDVSNMQIWYWSFEIITGPFLHPLPLLPGLSSMGQAS